MQVWKKASLSLAAAGLLCCSPAFSGPASAADQYSATFYVAAMGGHFAVADMTIDPGNEYPLQLHQLDKIDIGDNETHATHDPRIDVNNRNILFWSTYHIDPNTNQTHVGKTDLSTGQKILDINVPTPEEATHTHHMYCASAQTKDYYLPISMTNKAYIDVFRKSDLYHVRTVFLEGTDADIHKPYLFYHGINSPDMTKLLITINEAEKDQGAPVGKLHLFLLDMNEIIKGRVKVLAHNVVPGKPGRTMSFRQYFSPDGKLIANSGADRMYLLNAETLELLDAEMLDPSEENHDDIFTPDSKYIIATSRTKMLETAASKLSLKNPFCQTEISGQDDPRKLIKEDNFIMDGQLKLYDVAAQKFIGNATSVCMPCHNKEGVEQHAVLCGIEANWK